jgi:hypothetical protein
LPLRNSAMGAGAAGLVWIDLGELSNRFGLRIVVL